MTSDEPELQTLIEYITDRCLSAANQDKKDSFVDYLVDYSEIVEDYLSEREKLADTVNEHSDRTIQRTLRNGFRSLYDSLLDESYDYRREVLSAIVSAARGAKQRDFNSLYINLLSDLKRCYVMEQQSGEMVFDLKRFFVRRYSILLDQPLDELKTSKTEEQLENRFEVWKQAFMQAIELLRTMVEYSDKKSYSHLVSRFTDFYPYEMVHSNGDNNSTERKIELLRTNVEYSDEESYSHLASRFTEFFPYEMVHPDGYYTNSRGQYEWRELKIEYGEKVRSEVSVMTFVISAWAFRLLKNDRMTRETYSEIAAETQSERSSIEEVAETYYTMIRSPVDGELGYWERWNMDEALEEEMGAAVTSMSVHSWLRDFYCAELLRLGSDSDWVTDQESERETPIPAVRQVTNESESLNKGFGQLRDESLTEFLTADVDDLDILIDTLVQLHDDAAEQYRDDMREEIRNQDLDESKKDEFRASVKKKFDEECTLRNVMSTQSLITVGEIRDKSHHLVDLQIPRRKLVSVDAIPIMDSIQRYANPIIEKFSRLVFEELEFEPVQVNSNDQLIQRIDEYSDSRGVEAVLTSLGITDQVFRDDSKYDPFVPPDERIFENQRGTYAGIPVISIRYEEPVVVLLFDKPDQIVEPDLSEAPLEIEIEPGEEALSEEDRNQMTEDKINQWHDVARARICYKGEFRPQGTTGVHITIHNND
ncbi:hypothetical protein ACFO5R_14110 [Halosolutus amylolyticus]|uniref:Uncharacterized protein n=1 Tax=Halosolutus amylolyticus TaxID=2932267 RepID=A0ABD5PT12_9EURY|nr:hypothetical protein [Halosolutus amylolyticus]